MIQRSLKAPTEPVYDFTTLQHHLDRGGLYASDKEDGIRCLITPDGAVSQKMLPIPNRWVQEILMNHCPFHLDGELVALDCEGNDCTFNDTQSAIMSHDGQPRFVFRVFDWFGDTLASYEARKRTGQYKIVQEVTNNCIEWLTQSLCRTVKEIECLEADALARGKEGLMLRHPKGIYKQGRSTLSEAYLLKVKRFKDDEARVIGIEEEMENCNPATRDAHGLAKRSKHQAGMRGKYRVGKLICNWRGHTIKVASGMTDQQKIDWWANPLLIVSQSITFRYQAHGMKDLPRCPVFHGIRHD